MSLPFVNLHRHTADERWLNYFNNADNWDTNETPSGG